MIAKESPLKGLTIGTVEKLAIRELPGLHSFNLRVSPESSSQVAIEKALGMDLPGKTGQSRVKSESGDSESHALCLGPDWWLITGFQEAEQKLASLRLNEEYHFSIVDVSSQRTTIEVEGPDAREVLAHLWDQDLREKSFPVSGVSQGLMARAPVIVWHIGGFRYRVLARSSFAVHLWKALVDAAEELL